VEAKDNFKVGTCYSNISVAAELAVFSIQLLDIPA
jgi:hypothetical protein